jgi:hypothetical protein
MRDKQTIAQEHIPEALEMHHDQQFSGKSTTVPLFEGSAGLGKSFLIKKYADDHSLQFWDCRLANQLPSDIRLPYFDKEEGKACYAVTEELPCHRTDGQHLVFLDEVLQCPPAMQKIGMQITHDRSVGNKKLPDQTFIVAAGNGAGTRSHAERFGIAQANRFCWYYVLPDMAGFKRMLEDSGSYPMLVAFLESNHVAYDFDPDKFDGQSNVPTFRSLQEAGNVINYQMQKSSTGNLSLGRVASAAIQGCIGSKAAGALDQFIQIYNSVGSIDNLLADPDGCEIPEDKTLKMIISCKLAGCANDQNMESVMRVTQRLGDSGFDSHYAAFVAKTIAVQSSSLLNNKYFQKLAASVLASTTGSIN